MKCARCKRGLKDPESIKAGMGPVCRAKAGIGTGREQQQDKILGPFTGDVILERIDGEAWTNIPHNIVRHSPAGFEWGYGGSGPSDLALNILAAYIGQEAAEKDGLYQDFKWDFIATMPKEGGTITREQIAAWLKERGIEMPTPATGEGSRP